MQITPVDSKPEKYNSSISFYFFLSIPNLRGSYKLIKWIFTFFRNMRHSVAIKNCNLSNQYVQQNFSLCCYVSFRDLQNFPEAHFHSSHLHIFSPQNFENFDSWWNISLGSIWHEPLVARIKLCGWHKHVGNTTKRTAFSSKVPW